jgi:hypothetical protein
MPTRRIIGLMVGETFDCAALLDDVRRLHDCPSPLLEDVERLLTDGYACVLRTEGERLRLRDRLQERAALLGPAPDPGDAVEITALAEGIAQADSEIQELRAALAALAARVPRLRVA